MNLYFWIVRVALAGLLVPPIAAVFQWLWNRTMPALGLAALGYWQAVRLILLFSILAAPSCVVLVKH